MNNVFYKKYTPRVYDFDMNMNIKPSSILNFLQDAAGNHSHLLNVGSTHLAKKGLFFALTKIKCEFYDNIKNGENIIVQTAPGKKSKMVFMRDFIVTDENQKVLAKSVSRWCLVDLNTRRPVPSERIDFDLETTFSADIEIEQLSKNDGAVTYVYSPAYCDLDFNGHVNNAKYADALLNAIGKDRLANKRVKTFQINYIKESLNNEQIDFYSTFSGNNIDITASCNGDIRITAKVVLCDTY